MNLLYEENLHQHVAIYENKGDKHSSTNYQLASLASIVCLLMEKLMRDAKLQFFQFKNILTKK